MTVWRWVGSLDSTVLLKLSKLPKVGGTTLLVLLPKGVEDRLLDRDGSIAGPDGLQIDLIGLVDLGQCGDQLSHPFVVLLGVLVV
jgi:hypothetical protein